MLLTEYKEKCVSLLSRCVCLTESKSCTSSVGYGFVNKTPISQSVFSWMIINIKWKKRLVCCNRLGIPWEHQIKVCSPCRTSQSLQCVDVHGDHVKESWWSLRGASPKVIGHKPFLEKIVCTHFDMVDICSWFWTKEKLNCFEGVYFLSLSTFPWVYHPLPSDSASTRVEVHLEFAWNCPGFSTESPMSWETSVPGKLRQLDNPTFGWNFFNCLSLKNVSWIFKFKSGL